MNKEEITEKAQELTIKNVTDGKNKYFSWGVYKGCIVGLEYNNKQITELEEKISVLLSCKNCPENKGGYICEKEYENKCLSQKIQFIKELQQENAELKEQNRSYEQLIDTSSVTLAKERLKNYKQLSKAKEIIKTFLGFAEAFGYSPSMDKFITEAEQFLNSEVEK